MASNLRVDNIQPSVGMGIGIGTANGSVTFNADVTGGMNITTGSVGVGTDNPTEKLDVNGALKVYANTNIATFKNNQLRSDAAGAYYFDHGTTGQSFTFRTSTSSSLDTTGPSVTSAGNISFPSGKGIDFSATANSSGTMTSELLDDYEEGSWTPNFSFNGNSTGLTYSNRGGLYTRIGRLVTCYCMIVLSNKGSSTGNVLVSGLPYTATDLVAGTGIEGGGHAIYQDDTTGTHTGPIQAAVINNQSYFDLYRVTSTNPGHSDVVTNGNVTNTSSYRFVLQYTAA